MKHQLLFILLMLSVAIGHTQDVASVVMYKFDDVQQQYFPHAKYDYEYDEDDDSRLRAYDKYDFVEGETKWQIGQHMVRDFNSYNHLVQSVWTNYKNGSIKNSIDKTYDIIYEVDGQIDQVMETRYNAVSNETTNKELVDQVLKRVTDYRPIHNKYTPAYLAEHGFDLIYNESNQLVYGQLESCRLVEYHFTYGLDGRAKHVEINRIGDDGIMKKQSKVILIYDEAYKPQVASDLVISVFPNPAKGLVSIQLDKSTEKAQELNLTDLYGRVIRVILVDAFQIEKKIDVSDLAAGIYLLSATEGGASVQLVKVD